MKFREYVDPTAVLVQAADGFIKTQQHPTEPLTIFNYTNKAQYENHWTTETKRCRGLIVNNDTDEVVARPFEKFFNWGQVDRDMLPREGPIRVQDKMDGSLGILYRAPSTGELGIATRGSFTSDQAIHATALLAERYPSFVPLDGCTYLFEIIYPENRIVVDYRDQDDLVLLDILETDNGNSLIDLYWARSTWPGPVVERFEYPFIEDVLNTEPRPGREGFVITYPNGFRVKVKQDEYVRLHRLLTGVSSKTIWEILSSNGDISEIIDRVPDEYYAWVESTIASLSMEFSLLKSNARRKFESIMREIPTEKVAVSEQGDDELRTRVDAHEQRKWFAAYARATEHPGLLFSLYDGKDIDQAIWRLIKPEYSKPFWNANEDVA